MVFKLGMVIRNFSIGGPSNEEIFLNFMNNCDKMEKGDYVIVQWTYMNRFLWGLPNHLWVNEPPTPFGKFKSKY